MNFFKKVQNLDIFWKKALVFLVILGVGVPLSFFCVKNFQKRIKELDKEKFLKDMGLSEIKQVTKTPALEELKKSKQELEKEFERLGKMIEEIPTSTTSTVD
ncbi:hypothetical protein J7K42_02635 [bacterium]|nr:hypothetical protein [bacterium]